MPTAPLTGRMISRFVGPALTSATSITHSSAGSPSTLTKPPSEALYRGWQRVVPKVDSNHAVAASKSSVTYASWNTSRSRSLSDRNGSAPQVAIGYPVVVVDRHLLLPAEAVPIEAGGVHDDGDVLHVGQILREDL